MSETDPNEGRDTLWMDAGHITPYPDDVRVQNGKVFVYSDNGEIVSPQPDYPVEAPTEATPKADTEHAAKAKER